MALHPREIPSIPEEAMRGAGAAFPRGNVYTHMRDELAAIYNDQLFAPYFQPVGSQQRRPGAWP